MSAETKYRVVTEVRTVHEIAAESPEEAQRYVEEGDGGYGEVEDAQVVAVVAHDDRWNEHDLRAPRRCSGTCGKLIPAAECNPCTPCFMATFVAKTAPSTADGIVDRRPPIIVTEHRVSCVLESCTCRGSEHDGVCQLCGPMDQCDERQDGDR